MDNPHLGKSKRDLKDMLLARLNELANLRTESRRYREGLALSRSLLAEVEFEIRQLQDALENTSVVQFPAQPEPVRPPRQIGRWGAVSYEAPASTPAPAREKNKRSAQACIKSASRNV